MARSIEVQLLDAFAARPFGGNVAGVVLDADGLAVDRMAVVAAELNAPTTGFVSASEHGAPRLRFFTPDTEIDLCGHVTLAAAVALRLDGRLDGRRRVVFDTRAGARPVEVSAAESDNWARASLLQPVPELLPAAPEPTSVSRALDIELADLEVGLPMEIAVTGLRHLIVGLRHPAVLSRLDPDPAELLVLSRAIGVDTVVPFAMADDAGVHVRCRDFCIAIGELEEAASGTTNSGLAAYLQRHSLLAGDSASAVTGATEIVVRALQGVELGRPSRITTRLEIRDDGGIASVRVEGTVHRTLVGTMTLP